MIKHGIDQQALIQQFSQATSKQGEALRKAVNDATLKALQGRELTLANIKQVLNTVAKAASTGAAGSPLAEAEVEGLLGKAFAGMDGALEQAVQANRKALQQMVDQGASLRESQLKKALADIEKMEDALFDAVRKAAAGAAGAAGPGAALQGPWARVLDGEQGKSTHTGALASTTIEQLLDSVQQGLRNGRAVGLQASQAMLDGYSTLVSGVLIGMSDALQPGAVSPASARASKG